MTDSVRGSAHQAEDHPVAKKVLAHVADHRGRLRVKKAVRDALEGLEYQQLAKLKLNRAISALADAGITQRDIAAMVGMSQPEVSRRLKRRELHARRPGPRDVALERLAGDLTSEQMIKKLTEMRLTAGTPGKAGAYDGAASATGTKKQLMEALREGLLTDDEYEAVRAGRTRHHRS